MQGEGPEGIQVSRSGNPGEEAAAWAGGSHEAVSETYVSQPRLV